MDTVGCKLYTEEISPHCAIMALAHLPCWEEWHHCGISRGMPKAHSDCCSMSAVNSWRGGWVSMPMASPTMGHWVDYELGVRYHVPCWKVSQVWSSHLLQCLRHVLGGSVQFRFVSKDVQLPRVLSRVHEHVKENLKRKWHDAKINIYYTVNVDK